jgi:hypothetical protein
MTLLLTSATALGHSPVDPEEGESLATATHVEDPAKSWVIYGHLDGPGDAWYFEMEMGAGERLYLSLLSTEKGFIPAMVVMGPGWERPANGTVDVEVPDGYGWVLVPGEPTEAEYEPFTPGSYYHVAEFDEEVDGAGTYYVAVRSEEGEGPFSVAVGYVETFTAVEWLSLPASLVSIYRWEGQGWGTILGPAVAVLVGGLAFIIWHLRKEDGALSVFQWMSALSGLFILSWAAIVLTQMTMALAKSGWSSAALVTMGFAMGSLLMGYYALSTPFKGPEVPDGGRRVGMLMVAGVALFLYSGLYAGPVLAVVAALLPVKVAGAVLRSRGSGETGSVTGGS